ncbi:transcription initiation factor TFIIIB [Pyrobaculum arsenaticum]|uniref:Transcription factor TFIIB, cyclin-related protein n=2 Tax=Pyrobaculum arsenaticum TaxID=121277 RepID=A4WLD5_PYRAR|nr:transcription initiation factor TFIIIB [Pyrobaculum arsenaticum]ABP51202.1 Transcription factor TFIIB, cyclin-related protein [Pyrobaculum arsenaticum DSM 13514]NYR15075.1 transcription initiation factor IIB family protein [Pyrobaculum arsenaticum]
MTIRGAARAAFPWPSCPHCQSANAAADGEYVCRECGTVIGPVLVPPVTKEAPRPPPRYRLIMTALERESRRSVRRYSEVVKMHLGKVAKALGAEVAAVALDIFKRLDKRVYQGRSPRVVAATLAYLAAERLGIYVHKRVIAEILKVSKFTIKDTVWRLRRYLQEA